MTITIRFDEDAAEYVASFDECEGLGDTKFEALRDLADQLQLEEI